MKGRARVLDSRYLEFIEYLKKLGEQQNIVRIIHRLSNQQYEAGGELAGFHMEKSDADKMMYSFWQRGWIEIREMEKQGKNGHGKEYTLKVRLDEIVEYLNHEREGRSAGAKISLSKQEVPVLG